jgi:nicotinate-nucleotide adenylyltransferase
MLTAVFGGSFDPPHIGHLLAMTEVLSLGRADDILMIPCATHPFGKAAAPFEHRLAMCRLTAAAVGAGRVVVSDIERRRALSGRTLDTLLAVRQEMPDRELGFLVGADILDERDRWYRFDEIERLAPLIVIGRGPDEAGAADAAGALLCVAPVSSTEVRRRIAAGEDCSGLVTPDVLAYIEKKGLYR